MPRNHLPSPDGVAGTKSPACDGTVGCPQCLAAKAQHQRSDASQRHGAPCRSRERTGAHPFTAMGLRRGTTRLPGKLLGVGRDQVAARRIARDGERSPSCLTSQATRGDVGAEWLAGQMSKDTPRPPHATAREHASGAMPHIVRDPQVLEVRGCGSPITTEHVPVPSPAVRRGRGTRAIRPPAPISHFV